MRSLFLGFMAIMMLTPLLTCAMPFCPMKAAIASEHKPCHSQPDSQVSKKTSTMLIADCMGVDLFQFHAHSDIPKPDLALDMIDFVWAGLSADYTARPIAVQTIRAPPGKEGNLPNGPSLILTTQRYRI